MWCFLLSERRVTMINRYNEDIRQKISDAGLTLCTAAYKIGVSENTFFRWLRRPLDEQHKQIILKAIDC